MFYPQSMQLALAQARRITSATLLVRQPVLLIARRAIRARDAPHASTANTSLLPALACPQLSVAPATTHHRAH